MYNWNTETALDALYPTKRLSPEQLNRFDYFAKADAKGPRTTTSPRQWLATSLLKLAILLDGRAQAALIEARAGHR